jgi:hypothetical protein
MKSPLQTAFEKLTDEELEYLFHFSTDRSKGAAARLWVFSESIEKEQHRRGTIEPKVKGINLLTHPDEAMADLVLNIRSNQAAHVNIAKGTKAAMAKLDDPAFISAARAHYGVNDFYGDEALKAARELDEGFFNAAIESVRCIKSKNKNAKIQAGESRMLFHIEAALKILHKGDTQGEKPHRKVAKIWLRESLERMLEDPFSDEASWQKFFKRSEIKPYVTQERSGGRPQTSGKGR